MQTEQAVTPENPLKVIVAGGGVGGLFLAKALQKQGFGEVVVDVGLGEDAAETVAAVRQGYVVFAFEPMPANYAKVTHAGCANQQPLALMHLPLP